MKNFKKVLALVLAIATLLSFATVASAKTADFADAKDVKNVEAVDVLSYIKVLEGYPADKSFKPAKNITREEAAKIIAIFANKSTDISSLYTSANPFADMKGRWGESYVAYGYRAGIIAGKNATSFVPKANVKGTEFLKMVLVVLGYDQNKEGLVGSSWAVNTLELAKVMGLLKGLDNFDANAALTRDQAAQIMLNALKAEKVVYGQTVTNLVWDTKNGYWTIGNTAVAAAAVYVSPNGAQKNYSHELLAKDFGLTLVASQDKWGRPTHTWNKGVNTIGEYVDSDKLVKSYTTAVTECDVATAAGLKAKKVYKLFVNGTESTYEVQPTDTFTKIGAQGRLTEVYTDRIVMVDTFLAKVTAVSEPAFDAAGHLKTEATIELAVYDQKTATGTPASTLKLTNGSTSFGYAKGDFVLVNAYTTRGTYNTTGIVAAAPSTVYGEIVGKAESFEGAQTIIWHNANKHTVGGTAYDDAVAFNYDEAQKNIGSYTWFKDQYGNLIGDVKVATVFSYGVITSMKYDVTTAKVTADVTYVDGTTNTLTVSSINLAKTAADKGRTPLLDNTYTSSNTVMRFSNDYFYVSIDPKVNALADDIKNVAGSADREDIIDGHLMQIETLADSTVAMTKVTNEFTVANGTKLDARYGILTTGVKVDSETLFLVGTKDSKGVYSYKAYKGVNEVPTFSTGAIVDYVASNGYAKYVYIIGAADQAITNGFVYIANNAYYEELYTDANGVQYYKLDLVVPAEDGSKATLTIKSTSSYTKGTVTMTGAQVKDTLTHATNNGVLYYVTFKDGYAVFAEEVTWSEKQYDTADVNTGAVYYTSVAPNTYATYENSILRLGTMSFNTSAATEVVGKLEATMVDKQIYVIYNTATR